MALGLLLPMAFGLVLWLILWRFVYGHLKELRGKLNVEIREKVVPDVGRAASQLVTLASASLVLTFTLVQIWRRQLVAESSLLLAWGAFLVSILAGVVLSLALYVYRTQCLCMVAALEKADGTASAEERQMWIGRIWKLEKLLFALLTLQPVAFFVALALVLGFAMQNMVDSDQIARISQSEAFLVGSVLALAVTLCAVAVLAYRALRENRRGVA